MGKVALQIINKLSVVFIWPRIHECPRIFYKNDFLLMEIRVVVAGKIFKKEFTVRH